MTIIDLKLALLDQYLLIATNVVSSRVNSYLSILLLLPFPYFANLSVALIQWLSIIGWLTTVESLEFESLVFFEKLKKNLD